MQTNDLIESLSKGLRPTPSRGRLLGIAMLIGGVIAFGVLVVLLGLRDDLPRAIFTSAFWMKWGFTLTTGVLAFLLCMRLARPETEPGWSLLTLIVPIVALVALACIQLLGTPMAERRTLWMGQSALQCLWCIPVLAVPFLLATLWAFRRFAPTRLRIAGFGAGALAGAAAAAVYALHCDETAPAFVATWYSIGILLPALVGLVIGPRALRW